MTGKRAVTAAASESELASRAVAPNAVAASRADRGAFSSTVKAVRRYLSAALNRTSIASLSVGLDDNFQIPVNSRLCDFISRLRSQKFPSRPATGICMQEIDIMTKFFGESMLRRAEIGFFPVIFPLIGNFARYRKLYGSMSIWMRAEPATRTRESQSRRIGCRRTSRAALTRKRRR